LGIIPLVVAVPAAGAAAVWLWRQYGSPAQALTRWVAPDVEPGRIPAPPAPQSAWQMTVPGAWTPALVREQWAAETRESQRRAAEGQVRLLPAGAPGDGAGWLPLVAAGVAAVAGLALLRR